MAFEAVYVLILVLVGLLVIVLKQARISKERQKAPQPPSWPVIGHLHLLTINPRIHRVLALLSQCYGPVMHLQLGSRPALIISSSELAKECLTRNDRIFASRPRGAAGKHLGCDYQVLGFDSYGSQWRNLRRICTLKLFSANRIESFRHIRVEENSALIRFLFQKCCISPSGSTTVNVKSRLAELTVNMIVRTVASKRCLAPDYSEGSPQAKYIKDMINESFLIAGAFNVGDYLPFLSWFDLQGLEAAMKKLHKKSDDFMGSLIKDHRERRRIQLQAHQAVVEEDFIDALLSAADNQEIPSDTAVNITAFELINAGTDSSAIAIEWALASLLQNPHILRNVQAELDTHIGRDRIIEESDLHKLKYLEAVIKETLRLYPPGGIIAPHESTEACTVGGFHVGAGTTLIVNAWAIQRDPAVWERPDEFDPERFFNKEIDVKGQHFELIPFGAGRRMCPGMPLAMRVVSYTLGRLLHSFDWSVPAGTHIDMTEGFGVTMPKLLPLEAVVQPRLPLHFY